MRSVDQSGMFKRGPRLVDLGLLRRTSVAAGMDTS